MHLLTNCAIAIKCIALYNVKIVLSNAFTNGILTNRLVRYHASHEWKCRVQYNQPIELDKCTIYKNVPEYRNALNNVTMQNTQMLKTSSKTKLFRPNLHRTPTMLRGGIKLKSFKHSRYLEYSWFCYKIQILHIVWWEKLVFVWPHFFLNFIINFRIF